MAKQQWFATSRFAARDIPTNTVKVYASLDRKPDRTIVVKISETDIAGLKSVLVAWEQQKKESTA